MAAGWRSGIGWLCRMRSQAVTAGLACVLLGVCMVYGGEVSTLHSAVGGQHQSALPGLLALVSAAPHVTCCCATFGTLTFLLRQPASAGVLGCSIS